MSKNLNFSQVLVLSFLFLGCATSVNQPNTRLVAPAVVDGVMHQQSHFFGVRQTNIFEQSWKFSRSESKAVVIMVHGLKDHSDRYAQTAEKLTKNAFSVYAFDLRGHGQSEGRRVWTDSFDDYVQDLEIFYDRVRQYEPGKPIFIFGHSMGGAIATTFALKKYRPIAGLILSAPALKPGEDINGFLIGVTKVLGSITPSLAVLELNDEKFSRDPLVIAESKKDPLIYHGNGPARTAKELLKALGQIEEKMPEVDVPFIVLHGDKDVITNPDGSRQLFAKAKATDKTIQIYEGLFHDLLHEPEKDRVYRDILAWLNNRSPVKAEVKASSVKKATRSQK